MMTDVARRPNTANVHAAEEIEIDDPGRGRDHDHNLDHGIDAADLNAAIDRITANGWSTIDRGDGILQLKHTTFC